MAFAPPKQNFESRPSTAKVKRNYNFETASFKSTERVFEFQNPLKSPEGLKGNLIRRYNQTNKPATWESLLSNTITHPVQHHPVCTSKIKSQERQSARTVNPDMQDLPEQPKRHKISSESLVSSPVRLNDEKKITDCARRSNSRVYEHTIKLAHNEKPTVHPKLSYQDVSGLTSSPTSTNRRVNEATKSILTNNIMK